MNEIDLKRLRKRYSYEIGELGIYCESFFDFLSRFFGNKRELSDEELSIVEKKLMGMLALLVENKIDREIISFFKSEIKKISKEKRIQWGDFQALKDLLVPIEA